MSWKRDSIQCYSHLLKCEDVQTVIFVFHCEGFLVFICSTSRESFERTAGALEWAG